MKRYSKCLHQSCLMHPKKTHTIHLFLARASFYSQSNCFFHTKTQQQNKKICFYFINVTIDINEIIIKKKKKTEKIDISGMFSNITYVGENEMHASSMNQKCLLSAFKIKSQQKKRVKNIKKNIVNHCIRWWKPMPKIDVKIKHCFEHTL